YRKNLSGSGGKGPSPPGPWLIFGFLAYMTCAAGESQDRQRSHMQNLLPPPPSFGAIETPASCGLARSSAILSLATSSHRTGLDLHNRSRVFVLMRVPLGCRAKMSGFCS